MYQYIFSFKHGAQVRQGERTGPVSSKGPYGAYEVIMVPDGVVVTVNAHNLTSAESVCEYVIKKLRKHVFGEAMVFSKADEMTPGRTPSSNTGVD